MEISRLQTIPGFSRVYLQPNFYAQEERKSFCSLISVVQRANRPADLFDIVWPFCVNMRSPRFY
jgi:hypothetical protein